LTLPFSYLVAAGLEELAFRSVALVPCCTLSLGWMASKVNFWKVLHASQPVRIFSDSSILIIQPIANYNENHGQRKRYK